MKSFRKTRAFTLVELIVVITILAILWTIGFLSLQGYSSSARDSARLSDLANLSTAMEARLAAGKALPQPNSPMVTLTASGTTIGYQWCAGPGVLGILGLSGKMRDPLNGTCYTYETNAEQNRYQVLSLQESSSQATALGELAVPTAYAGTYDTRVPSTRWSSLGILLWTGANLNQPVQEMYDASSFTGVDVANTTAEYTAVFGMGHSISGTGRLIITAYSTNSPEGKSISKYDPSLVGYWDMETTTMSWSQVLLRDLSRYGNDGTCYNSGAAVNCGTSGLWPQFVSGDWKSGKIMSFDGVDDWVWFSNKTPFIWNSNLTVCMSFKSQNTGVWIGFTLESIFRIKTWGGAGFDFATTNNPWCSVLVGVSWVDSKVPNHTCFVYNGNNFLSYLNWRFNSKSADVTWNIASSTPYAPMLWNGFASWTQFFLGTIDEVRIYNRALSDSEIQSLYDSDK